jgi:hypothetical protein
MGRYHPWDQEEPTRGPRQGMPGWDGSDRYAVTGAGESMAFKAR